MLAAFPHPPGLFLTCSAHFRRFSQTPHGAAASSVWASIAIRRKASARRSRLHLEYDGDACYSPRPSISLLAGGSSEASTGTLIGQCTPLGCRFIEATRRPAPAIHGVPRRHRLGLPATYYSTPLRFVNLAMGFKRIGAGAVISSGPARGVNGITGWRGRHQSLSLRERRPGNWAAASRVPHPHDGQFRNWALATPQVSTRR